jgi:hypothetical protein
MAKKAEIEARWADLSRRLGNDPKLAEVIDSLDRVLDDVIGEDRRERLKVPYANTTSIDDGSRWH